MNTLRQVLLVFQHELNGEGDVAYLKASDVGEVIGVGPKRAAHRFAYIRECESVPVSVERWSKTSAATTYRVCVPDWDALAEYVRDLRGEPEPTLKATA
jgi:hypothetical protein